MRKSSGYYIITDINNTNFKFKIISNNYFEKEITVNIDKIKNEDKYIEIYMVPHYKYSLSLSDIYFEGEADSDSEVFATKLSNRTNIRFISFDKEDYKIKVSNPAKESLIGRLMAVVNLEKNNFQPFFIKDVLSGRNSEYEIDHEINKTYKEMLPLQKTYVTLADKTGKYKLFVGNQWLEDEKYIILYWKKNKKTFKVIEKNQIIK